jgi:hypothetical protein
MEEKEENPALKDNQEHLGKGPMALLLHVVKNNQ